uniref:HMA domain-containing protein n=1 Tax=Oryza brachyantha TaxID=4533 RepID=J3KZ71_ORYBR
MASESETPRITELHVRMDCNGCEHKIRKTLRAIDGVSDVYVDSANQKVTVVGIADPERIVKAIRKTKRVPTIFSHTDPRSYLLDSGDLAKTRGIFSLLGEQTGEILSGIYAEIS